MPYFDGDIGKLRLYPFFRLIGRILFSLSH